MKNRVWLFQIPIVLTLAAAFWITQQGAEGDLSNTFLRERVFPNFRRYSSVFLDWKFHVRGPQAPKNKIVIVEVDSPALAEFGRWPWHRDKMAHLLDNLMALQPRAVGFDIVFSERDQTVSPEFLAELNDPRARELHDRKYNGDAQFTNALAQSLGASSKVVLGWMLEGTCQPGLDSIETCQLNDPLGSNSSRKSKRMAHASRASRISRLRKNGSADRRSTGRRPPC